jgi:hypothetical protein
MEALEPRPWNPARRCTATNRAGERCQRQPIPGGDVCVMHGGAAPQVQQSAKARLLAGADLAIDYLLKMLEPREPCERCGRSDLDRDPVVVRACQLVLDRAGFHPTLTVEHAAPPNPYKDFTEDELIERLEALLAAAVARRDLHRQHALPAAIDGVVDEGFVVPEDDDAPLETSTSEPEDVWSLPPGDVTKEPASD